MRACSRKWKSWHKDAREGPAVVRAALTNCTYLQHEGVMLDGVHVFASPYQPPVPMLTMEFNIAEEADRDAMYASIPAGVHVLLSHGLPFSKQDAIPSGKHVGCEALGRAVARGRPAFHVFGHTHEGYGMDSAAFSYRSKPCRA